MKKISINTEIIKLDSFLKWCGAVSTGAEAKIYIKNGEVKVNGEIEKRRGKKLKKGDVVEFKNEVYVIM